MAGQVTVGAILRRTFGGLAPNAQAIAFYVAGLSALGIGIELANDPEDMAVALRTSSLQFLLTLAGLFAQYLLVEHMLQKAGLLRVLGSKRFGAYIGQSILIGICFILGFLLLIVPGLILAARWSAAGPLLIGEQKGAIDAMKESWELTRGHTATLILAILAMAVIAIAAIGAASVLFLAEGRAGIFATEIVGNAVTALTASFAVAVFGLIHSPTEHLAEVFE